MFLSDYTHFIILILSQWKLKTLATVQFKTVVEVSSRKKYGVPVNFCKNTKKSLCGSFAEYCVNNVCEWVCKLEIPIKKVKRLLEFGIRNGCFLLKRGDHAKKICIFFFSKISKRNLFNLNHVRMELSNYHCPTLARPSC